MGRLLKFVLVVAAAAALVVLGYAIFSDLPAPTREVVVPIEMPDE